MEWRPWFQFLFSAVSSFSFTSINILGFWGRTAELINSAPMQIAQWGHIWALILLAFPCALVSALEFTCAPRLQADLAVAPHPLYPAIHSSFPSSPVKSRFCESGFTAKDQLATGQHPVASWPIFCFIWYHKSNKTKFTLSQRTGFWKES